MPGEDFVGVMAGAMRLALADRQTAYADAAENGRVAERLTSEEYAKEQRRRIFEGIEGPSSDGPSGAAGVANTSHLSCVDADGLAVSITNTMGYGSGLVVPGTGIPLNNALGEPELNPKGFHAVAPGERLISNMSPTVVSSEEGGLVSLGSPGASRISTAILQTLVNVLDFGMPLEAAVLAPRFHAEGDLFAYESGVPAAAPAGFGEMLPFNGPDMFFGGVNAVRHTPQGRFEAAADPRRSGGAAYA
jgi:gamma-glutamyltranspeptidase/glutathione hydrolase